MKIGHFKKAFEGTKSHDGNTSSVKDHIIVEEALQINLNGKPFTVTMRTPGSDRNLIRGLLFTEGIYTGQEQLKMKVTDHSHDGYPSVIEVWIPAEYIGGAYYQSRSMLSVSSCGICGKRELSDLLKGGEPLHSDITIQPGSVMGMFKTMRSSQVTFECTGGSHAAAIFAKSGELLALEEDIGRHNAVDKVIGQLLTRGNLKEGSIMLVSGRVSYEIVSKTFRAGIPVLAAVSSPSSLSIESAEAMGITLLAFCRGDALTCYSYESRMITNELIP